MCEHNFMIKSLIIHDNITIMTHRFTVNSPELRVVAVNGDRLRHIEGIFEDKLHVLSRAEAGIQQVLCGDGLAQHIGDALCLAALCNGFDLMKFFGQSAFLHLSLKDHDSRKC